MTSLPLPQASQDNKQIQEYVTAAVHGMRSQIIVAVDGKWLVRSLGGTTRATRFATKEAALSFAKKAGGTIIFPDEP